MKTFGIAMTAHVFRPNRILSSDSGYELTLLIDQALLTESSPTIVIDFWDTALIDSRGLSALMRCMQRLKEIGGELVLCGVFGQARMLLEITNTYQLFTIYSDMNAFQQATQMVC
jgi:anti-anti-sigma factor